jgi:hypothetical protein
VSPTGASISWISKLQLPVESQTIHQTEDLTTNFNGTGFCYFVDNLSAAHVRRNWLDEVQCVIFKWKMIAFLYHIPMYGEMKNISNFPKTKYLIAFII